MDMVFTDKTTAHTIAQRIRYGVHAPIRDVVDASMCGCKATNVYVCRNTLGDSPGQPLASAQMLAGGDSNSPTPCATNRELAARTREEQITAGPILP